MAAPNSKSDICNLAMDHLKQDAVIVNIDVPSTNEEKVCSRWYDATRRKLLRSHPWTFARSRKSIPRSATAPVFGYADAYQLPNEYLNLRFIGDDSTSNYELRYEIEGRRLLLDNAGALSLNIGFTEDVEDVTKMDAIFISVLALELAKKISYKFTLKLSVLNILDGELAREKAEAKAVNGQDRPPKIVSRSKWVTARKSLRSNNIAGKNTVFHE